ncbi:MAG: exo-alpha-sialidase, partial [Pirellulales bacterium]|nr:exo-alpha-sialidase [Pirellulales bacterium]
SMSLPAPADVSVCAYPSVALLSDGGLLCVYSAALSRGATKLALYATYSRDHGASWSEPALLLNTPGRNDYDSSIVVIGDRVIVSATTTAVGDETISSSKTMAVRSEDSGNNWSDAYEIPMGRKYTSGKTNNGIVLRDGTALLGFTWEKNLEQGSPPLSSEGEMEEVNAVLMSFDEGRTWTASESIELAERRSPEAKGAINGVCEPALAECGDGSILMLCRTGLSKLYSCRSHDSGRTWTAPQPSTLTSHNAPAALCSLTGERAGLIAVWNNSLEHRWPLCVAASTDNGSTWTALREIANIEGSESSYPCCTPTADGKILVVYQQALAGGREIRGVRFDPSWLFEQPASNPPFAAAAHDADPSNGTSRVEKAISPPRPPKKVSHFDEMPKPVILPDGTWAAYFLDHEGPGLAPTPATQDVYVKYSEDHGGTWSDKESLFDLPTDQGGFGYFVPLLDNRGEMHFFILCDVGTGAVRPRPAKSGEASVAPLLSQRLDVWHVKSTAGRTKWTEPRSIWEGRAGDLQSVTQLKNGRIILTVCYVVDRSWAHRGQGPNAFTFTGQFDTTVLYSDDEGSTWRTSSSVLRTPTPDLASYGAVEPVVLELHDGRVWMLLRTQQGRFYESFSNGGAEWSPAKPSDLKSSDSPAGLTRLPDGRILLLWNNCQRHPYAQGSRHVLHASISGDEGKTWNGYREIVRDPHRDSPPPPSGDHGVSYPFAAVGEDGEVIFSLWVETGEGRSLWALDPKWLDERHLHSDFSQGLEQWSTFGARGISIDSHPDKNDARLLTLVGSEDEWPTSAVWNFPLGFTGVLRARICLDEGASPLVFQLTDHFSPPFDEQGGFFSLFNFMLSTDGETPGAVQVTPGQWTDVVLRWNCGQRSCSLTVNGVTQNFAQQHVSPGPSYLRLSLAGEGIYPVGRVFVEQVEADVSPDVPAGPTGG